jgi:hypothetical protein
MSSEQQQTQEQGGQTQEQGQQRDEEGRNLTPKPDVTDEHKEQAKEMAKAYEEDRPTTTLPGSDGTVSGTAVTEWVDEQDKGNIETSAEEGKVQYRKTDEFRKTMEE